METDATTMNGSSAGSNTPKDAASSTLSGAMETAREKAGSMQAGLADLLDSSAKVIRSRGVSAGQAAASAGGQDGAERLAQSGEATAAVLERGAMWLRETDLSDVEARITSHVKKNPTQTLLIAAGIGFLLSRRR